MRKVDFILSGFAFLSVAVRVNIENNTFGFFVADTEKDLMPSVIIRINDST
jgi:hypothetical protein